eukprot:CAMPEP_0197039138 /NCGR_PEP_ID=MMETSP1384-20130603/15989_1 /TAXON_ID=29189 /ORGANISM="Ammonia sp." /LENGTH=295 /DNA_ID=CAMNT_0042469691 /DNA_START=19 /DNA_END=906 /DNA_ORIENTATION=-
MAQAVPRLRIGFIGGGQMATALSMGIINSGVLPNGSSIIIADPYKGQLDKIQSAFQSLKINSVSFETTTNNKDLFKRQCDIVFVAVKPQYLPPVMQELHSFFTGTEIIVSMVTGTKLNVLQTQLTDRPNQPVIRIMPNTPALVGCGAFSITKGEHTSDQQLALVEMLLKPMGVVKRVDKEALIDSVTGLSGSGPAFVFMMIEAMADGGVKAGLPRQVALQLAAQTVLGAATMVLKTGQHPGELKDAVASPAGTTIAGIKELEKNNFRYAVMSAVEAAANRATELGQTDNQKKSKL